MTRAIRTAEYTGATPLCLYRAFELGSNEWKLGFTTECPEGRMPTRGAQCELVDLPIEHDTKRKHSD